MSQTKSPFEAILSNLTSVSADDFTKHYNEALLERARHEARRAKADADIQETLLAYYKDLIETNKSGTRLPDMKNPFSS